MDTTVLVVDDIPANLIAMQALLQEPGVRVLTAPSGPHALECLLQHDVAVALLDVHMPGMDGFELAELMRGSERTRHVPLIFLTAAAQDQQRLFRGYDAGAVDFLHKPIEPHVIASKVRIFVDMHRQRRQLAEQRDALQEALRINELFTAVLSHDLRNPLSAIRMTGRLLERQAGELPAVRDAAERISQCSERMARMIDQLLDCARLRAQGLRLDPQMLDLTELTRDVLAEFTGSGTSRIELQARGDLRVRLDGDRIAQVLSNLVGNALEHGQPDWPIQVRLDGSGPDEVVVEVANGGDIPAATRDTLFQPFHSGRHDGPPTRGLGLGLFIVDQFARAHGGSAQLASAPKGWTCIRVRLPRQVGSNVPGAAPRGRDEPGVGPHRSGAGDLHEAPARPQPSVSAEAPQPSRQAAG
ncbi:MAG: hybrid sensor histidine kinase/response regulator [Pseudomonadota bacterium]